MAGKEADCVCSICYKDTSKQRSAVKNNEPMLKCELCENHYYHVLCLQKKKTQDQCLEEYKTYGNTNGLTSFLCPETHGCNIEAVNKLVKDDWLCMGGKCKNKADIICSKCENYSCKECSGITQLTVKVYKMLSNLFLFTCRKCKEEADQSDDQKNCKTVSCSDEEKDTVNDVSQDQSVMDCNEGDKITNKESSESLVIDDKHKTKLCYHYFRNNCIHGMSGKTCRFIHPKRCKKFMEQGWYGCRSSQLCQMFHPKVCENSFRHMSCTARSCAEIHIKDTRHKPQHKNVEVLEVPKLQKTDWNSSQKNQRRVWEENTGVTGNMQNTPPPDHNFLRNPNPHDFRNIRHENIMPIQMESEERKYEKLTRDSSTASDSFLEILKAMKDMEEKIQKIRQMVDQHQQYSLQFPPLPIPHAQRYQHQYRL